MIVAFSNSGSVSAKTSRLAVTWLRGGWALAQAKNVGREVPDLNPRQFLDCFVVRFDSQSDWLDPLSCY